MEEKLTAGFAYLAEGEFGKAETFFTKMISEDPKCGEAYFGRLMAYWKVKDRTGFGGLTRSITESSDYGNVLLYGDEKLKAELQAAADAANRNAAEIRYQRACQIMEGASSEKDYNDAAYWFGAVLKYQSNYKDAAQRKKFCEERGRELTVSEDELELFSEEPKKEEPYVDPYEAIARARAEQETKTPEKKSPQKKSPEKKPKQETKSPEKKPMEQKPDQQKNPEDVLFEKLGITDKEELQKARQRYQVKKEKKRQNSRKTKKTIAILVGLVIVVLGPVLLVKVAMPSMQLNNAKKMMENGDEARAYRILENLDRLDVYAEILSEQASEKMEDGWFEDALPLLLEAVDYDSSVQETLDSCLYRLAKREFADGNLSSAWDYYMRMSTYDSSDEIYLVCSYELGKSALNAADFNGYKRAADLLENCEHAYEDAKALKLEAMYGYVSNYPSRDDPLCVEFLEVLQAEGYEGLETVLDAMYPWRLEVVAINPIKDDYENSMQSISVGRAVYFHFLLHSAPDAQPLTLYANYRLPSGQSGSYEFAVEWEDGVYGWYGWENGVDSAGILTVEFTDQNGNVLGEGSMKITD